jgi:dipeptidyl aminopeptidase/acylaminoacyl peptidase
MRPNRTDRRAPCAGAVALGAALIFIPMAARASLPPLIPRAALLAQPDRFGPQLSPDGRRLAYFARDPHGVLQIWVQTIGRNDARMVTREQKGDNIWFFQWSYLRDVILFARDNGGDEVTHIYSVSLRTGLVRDLTPFAGVKAAWCLASPRDPHQVRIALNLEDRRRFDQYQVDLTTGAITLQLRNPGIDETLLGDVETWRTLGVQVPTGDGGGEIRLRSGGREKTVLRWGPDDHVEFGDFTADGRSMWYLTDQGLNTKSLMKLDLATGRKTLLASDPHSDVAGILRNPRTHEPEAVAYNRERIMWKPLNPRIAPDLEALRNGALGEFSIVSFDHDWQRWVVAYAADVRPVDYYLYDRHTRRLTHLFNPHPDLARYTLAPMKPEIIRSRDGLDLVSYLTLPVGLSPRSLTMVLMVHGGPWGQDRWGYNPEAQWLANRGYAVLQVNFRGSSGFGKQFSNAGYRESAGKMHNDLIDAVQWAIREGIADPRRIAIYGVSYGGYAALVGATFTPDVFACAISLCGMSNLVTFSHARAPFYDQFSKTIQRWYGNPDTEAEFLKSRSPFFKVDRIRSPLLIAQGANDPNVPREEADQIVAALRQAGKPVEYLLFPDEGHGLYRPENRLKFYAAMEAFLARYLGGRVEPAVQAPAAR